MASGLHEEFARDYHVEAASEKRFGLVVGGILLAFGCIRAWLHSEIGWFSGLLGGVGLVLIVAALIKPAVLAPANRGWAKLGLLLHKVTNPLFLGVMYALAIVPTGLMMRAFGADPMGRKRRSQRHLLDRPRKRRIERAVFGKAVLRFRCRFSKTCLRSCSRGRNSGCFPRWC